MNDLSQLDGGELLVRTQANYANGLSLPLVEVQRRFLVQEPSENVTANLSASATQSEALLSAETR